MVSVWSNHLYPTPGDHRIRGIVTVVPCDLAIIDAPPDLPPAVFSPASEPVVVEASTVVTSQQG